MTDKVELSSRARAFVHTSIRLDRRRRRRATTILSALLVLAITAAGVAFAQQRTAQQQYRAAVARGLVAQADAVRDADPRLALLLGIAAQRIHLDGETQASLVNTLTTTHYAGTLPGHSGAVRSVAFAPDGHTVATGSADNTVLLWDVSDRAHPHQLGQPLTGGGVTSVVFAPDGHTLATHSPEQGVLLWDLSDRAHPRRLGQPLTGGGEVEFAPDGHTLAIQNADQGMLLWDLSELHNLRRHAAERACLLTQRGLDRDEWARYIPDLPYQRTCFS